MPIHFNAATIAAVLCLWCLTNQSALKAQPCNSPPVVEILDRPDGPFDIDQFTARYDQRLLIDAIADAIAECDRLAVGTHERRLALRALMTLGDLDAQGRLVYRDRRQVATILSVVQNDGASAVPTVAQFLHRIDPVYDAEVRATVEKMLRAGEPAIAMAALQQVALIRSRSMSPLAPLLQSYLLDPEEANAGLRTERPDAPSDTTDRPASEPSVRMLMRSTAAQAYIATVGVASVFDAVHELDKEGEIAMVHAVAAELLVTNGALDGDVSTHRRAAAFVQGALRDPADRAVFVQRGMAWGIRAAALSPGLDPAARAQWVVTLEQALAESDAGIRRALLNGL